MEEMIPKESLEKQHMCILQGLKDSKEHSSGKSVLNPLQNSSRNHMSTWPRPCRLPGFTAWWMLTSVSRYAVHAAGAVMYCTRTEEIPSKPVARLACPERRVNICASICHPCKGRWWDACCWYPFLPCPAGTQSSHTAKTAFLLFLAGHWAAPTRINGWRWSGIWILAKIKKKKPRPKSKFAVTSGYNNK